MEEQQEQNIIIFKLTSGDEVIANMIGEQGQVFVLENPYAFTYTTTPDGKLNGGIMKWMGQSSDGIVMLNAHQVVATTTPKDEIIRAYNISAGNIPNIEIPEQKIILG